jgi:hypothetical protein
MFLVHSPDEFTLDFYNILHYTFAINSTIAIKHIDFH